MTYIVDRSNDWKFVDGVVDATYTSADGETTYSKVKVRLGAITTGDFTAGVGGSVQVLPAVIWPLASDEGQTPVTTVEVQATLTISGTTYQIVRIDSREADGSQYRVTLQVHV